MGMLLGWIVTCAIPLGIFLAVFLLQKNVSGKIVLLEGFALSFLISWFLFLKWGLSYGFGPSLIVHIIKYVVTVFIPAMLFSSILKGAKIYLPGRDAYIASAAVSAIVSVICWAIYLGVFF